MKSIRKMFGKRFRAGSYAAFAAIIVLVIAIIVNMIASGLPAKYTQLDLTANALYSLSEQTEKIVRTVTKPVNLYLLSYAGSEDETIARLLDNYASLNSNISVSYIDPSQKPTFLNQYDFSVSYANSVIVDCEGRARLVGYDEIYVTSYDYDYYSYNYTTTTEFCGESALTNAIHYVSSDNLPKVYTLSGHGESSLSSSITEQIAQQNMESESLSLLALESVPDDASLIIINVPSSDISEDEAAMLNAYLDQGGCIMLLTECMEEGKMTNLLSVTAHMGMTAGTGLVIEGDSQMAISRYPYYLLPELESHEITDPLISSGYYALMPLAHPIAEADGSAADVTWLLTTSSSAYSKAEGLNVTTTVRADGDAAGPFHVAAISELSDGKLCWFASGQMLGDNVDRTVSGGNSNLFMNALSYMCEQEESISIRAKSLDSASLTLSAAASTRLSILLVGAVPAAFLLVGLLITIRRKRR